MENLDRPRPPSRGLDDVDLPWGDLERLDLPLEDLSRSGPPSLDLDRPGPPSENVVRWMQHQRPPPPPRSRARDPNARARVRDAAGREPLDPGSTAHVLCPMRSRTRFTVRSWAVRLGINGSRPPASLGFLGKFPRALFLYWKKVLTLKMHIYSILIPFWMIPVVLILL